MPRFPSESADPRQLRWLPAFRALTELRSACGLAFSRASFYRWLQDGTIPARKLQSRWFVAREDIAAFARETFEP